MFWKYMNFLEFRNKLTSFTVFSLQDIRKVFPQFDRRRLTEWQDKRYLIKLRRGFYVFANQHIEERGLFLIANTMYQPSYISFESALSYYHFIPESVYGTTSATSLKTARFETPVGVFWYRTLQPRFLFGYSLIAFQERSIKIAEPEKALVDLLYLRKDLAKKEDFSELRLNRDEMKAKCNPKKFLLYLKKFRNDKLEKRGKILLLIYRI